MDVQLMDEEFKIVSNTGVTKGTSALSIKHKSNNITISHKITLPTAIELIYNSFPSISDVVNNLLIDVIIGLGFIE